jgi:hypothetical protein
VERVNRQARNARTHTRRSGLGRGSTSCGIDSDGVTTSSRSWKHRGVIAFGNFEDQGFRGTFLEKYHLLEDGWAYTP